MSGIHLEWSLHNVAINNIEPYAKRYFHLTCKEFREKIMKHYIKHVAKSAEKITDHQKNIYIYTHGRHRSIWERALFKHHTTSETLVIEPHLKNMMINDLEAFLKGKEFFKSVGRAWKRGYLLYGPPGTGKSSMVAAIANHLNYNIYDLQIQSIRDDGDLRAILSSTTNKSIILIEDIDCGASASSGHIDCGVSASSGRMNEMPIDDELQMYNKKKPDLGISLSGLLNFVDGLWSSCGEERIIIFTTNHKEKLDPVLLRPGRMDVHVLMDYWTPYMVKKLVLMYLKIDDHVLFDTIEKLILEVNVTPAEVTQQLMASKDVDIALKGLLEFLKSNKLNVEIETKET